MLDRPRTHLPYQSRDQSHGVLTVDLEDWRCALNPKRSSYMKPRPLIDEPYVSRLTYSLLESLKQSDSRATFFVPGEVARAVPDLLSEISKRDHEIASHAPFHLPVNSIPRDKLYALMQNDVSYIESVVGERPMGFRAPYFAIGKKDGWLFDMLRRLGFKYDSSVVPTWTPFWGMPFAPKHAYYPDFNDLSKVGQSRHILEVPVTVWPTWRCLPGLPIGGGLYFRIWPRRILKIALSNNVGRGVPLVLYLHPGDFDSDKESMNVPSLRDSITQYMGTSSTFARLHDVLGRFKFGTIRQTFARQLAAVNKNGE